uniref:Large ribosomal subunit protein eL14 domain-containing protein n=1 Tax=Alexandrium andersonii TaxID=327968 RepID=A0A7S2B0T1_9DINO
MAQGCQAPSPPDLSSAEAAARPPLQTPSPKAAMAMFKRFVEPGRLAVVTYGPCAGKMCTIIDIVDQQRVVVDGPQSLTGVARHMMPIRRLSLTDLKAGIVRGAREKTLRKALEKDDILSKFKATSWGKKIGAREARASMTDFDRFKVQMAKKRRSKAIKKVLKKK